jgi:hypothetical protein
MEGLSRKFSTTGAGLPLPPGFNALRVIFILPDKDAALNPSFNLFLIIEARNEKRNKDTDNFVTVGDVPANTHLN